MNPSELRTMIQPEVGRPCYCGLLAAVYLDAHAVTHFVLISIL